MGRSGVGPRKDVMGGQGLPWPRHSPSPNLSFIFMVPGPQTFPAPPRWSGFSHLTCVLLCGLVGSRLIRNQKLLCSSLPATSASQRLPV